MPHISRHIAAVLIRGPCARRVVPRTLSVAVLPAGRTPRARHRGETPGARGGPDSKGNRSPISVGAVGAVRVTVELRPVLGYHGALARHAVRVSGG